MKIKSQSFYSRILSMKSILMNSFSITLIIYLVLIPFIAALSQDDSDNISTVPREHLLMDFGWRFALGNAVDAKKDFDNGTGYFSYFAKAGYGDGAAAENFDDRGWRTLDLPHDWCVELPFDSLTGYSHGFKAIGLAYPENSIGWYRKTFLIPSSDLGKRISIEFDGVFRNSIVWVNGFYLGTENSGYTGFCYDITNYLNYGGENSVAVRVNATMEEGWFYEGAGIYRHVWLNKTSPLHIAEYGTFVTSKLKDNNAVITTRTTVVNDSSESMTFDIEEKILDEKGKTISSGTKKHLVLNPADKKEYFSNYDVNNPKLWSIENPYLHKLETVIRSEGKIADVYETTFGIRTVRFDPDQGFFLNGKRVEIKGTNEHQDIAGVGVALPDALQDFRIIKLKEMGSNAIRTAHNPPTPELLDACDRLGMLVLDENRLMGTNKEHFDCLENLIKRDRNHPSVILWSLGNEEWAIEGNIKGARITSAMQDFARQLDSSRAFTAACSGGWDNGIGMVAQVMGYNYMVQGDIDEHHSKFPWQSGLGTEETNTRCTRGIYVTDKSKGFLAPTNRMPQNVGTETGWKFYSARKYLAGLFYWTGFDYRGEPNPFGWPQVTSQSGLIDLCGFPKDTYYYLKSWWGDKPVLHIAAHWDWRNEIGKAIKVVVYSNCKQVELFLNDESLGKKTMSVNSHLDWNVEYHPGVLFAVGYNNDKKIITTKVETTGKPFTIKSTADRDEINADGQDVSVITIQVNDTDGRMVPDAENEIYFSVTGPGRIIGVGNGNPSSHEPDRYHETIKRVKIKDLKELPVENLSNRPEAAQGFDDSAWRPAFSNQDEDWQLYRDSLIVVRGTFTLPEITKDGEVNLFTKSITENQSVYINGHLIAAGIKRDSPNQSFTLNHDMISQGRNDYAITGKRFRKKNQWDVPNTDPGQVQVIYQSKQWKRKVFNGLAQVIIQSFKEPGEILLTAKSDGIKSSAIKIQTEEVKLKPEAN
ncbi:MAG: beta-galactosidase GalA [Ignavibacteriaceae bacterium]